MLLLLSRAWSRGERVQGCVGLVLEDGGAAGADFEATELLVRDT